MKSWFTILGRLTVCVYVLFPVYFVLAFTDAINGKYIQALALTAISFIAIFIAKYYIIAKLQESTEKTYVGVYKDKLKIGYLSTLKNSSFSFMLIYISTAVTGILLNVNSVYLLLYVTFCLLMLSFVNNIMLFANPVMRFFNYIEVYYVKFFVDDEEYKGFIVVPFLVEANNKEKVSIFLFQDSTTNRIWFADKKMLTC